MSATANAQLILMIALAGSGPRLLAAHEADLSGHCRTCRAGGASSGHVVAPCGLWLAASEATTLCADGCGWPRRLCGCLRLVEKGS